MTETAPAPAEPRIRQIGRQIARVVMVLIFFTAGYIHLRSPAPFLYVMPPWVPMPEAVVFWTGIAELAGAVALAQPINAALRKLAGWCLAAYVICVWPANINHFIMDMAKPDHGWGLGYHVPRMFAQPALAWLSVWSSGALDWPWRRTDPVIR